MAASGEERRGLRALGASALAFARRLWRDMGDLEFVLVSDGMAFDGFLSLVPLVALSGWFARAVSPDAEPLFTPLAAFLPPPVAELALEEGERLGEQASLLAPLGLAMFLWLASGVIATGFQAFERIHGATPRSYWRRRGVSLAFLAYALPFVGVCGAALGFGGRLGLGPTGSRVVLGLAMWLLAWSFFRIAAPRPLPGARRRGALVGSAVTLACWILSSTVFTSYVRTFARFPAFYGGLAAIVVLLVWLWLMAFSLLVGGYVHARVERG